MQSKVPFCLKLIKLPSLAFARKTICPYPKCGRKYKTEPELIVIITTDTNKNHPRQPSINVVFVTKYLKENLKIYAEDLPFKCLKCGDRFKLRSGHRIHMQAKHTTESLSDEF